MEKSLYLLGVVYLPTALLAVGRTAPWPSFGRSRFLLVAGCVFVLFLAVFPFGSMMVLDECVPYGADRAYTEKSLGLTSRWAARCRAAHPAGANGQLLFGIVQGGFFKDLRAQSAEQLIDLDFDGYALGGLSVGESRPEMYDILNDATPHLPADKPRYLMPQGGFSLSADDAEALIVRQRVFFDAAIPSGNSVAFFVLTTIFRLTGRQEFRDAATALSRAAAAQVAEHTASVSFLLCGLSQLLAPAAEVTVTGRTDAPDSKALLAALAGRYLPEVTVTVEPGDGPAVARVCRAGACQTPVSTPDALLASLHA